MSDGFGFLQLPRSTKILLVALTIFLLNLVIGMLILGDNNPLDAALNADSLLKGAEFVHMNP